MFAYSMNNVPQLRIGEGVRVYLDLGNPIDLDQPISSIDLSAAMVMGVEQWVYGWRSGYDCEPSSQFGYTPYCIDDRDGPDIPFAGVGSIEVVARAEQVLQNGFKAVLEFCETEEAKLQEAADAAELSPFLLFTFGETTGPE